MGFSVILWAMMTFPGPSQQQTKLYEDHRIQLKESFLSLPEVNRVIKDEQSLKELDRLSVLYKQALEKDEGSLKEYTTHPLFPIVEIIYSREGWPQKRHDNRNGHYLAVASAYVHFREKMAQVDFREQQDTLKGTFAGIVGQYLEKITRPLGFDYRTNIALLGGFAAKEVVVSTLGTAYSLGEVDPEESGSLSEKLGKDPNWSPLVAFTLILFTMLYVPCFVTLISIARESSWRWAVFSITFNLMAAYLISLLVYQVGSRLGVGI